METRETLITQDKNDRKWSKRNVLKRFPGLLTTEIGVCTKATQFKLSFHS